MGQRALGALFLETHPADRVETWGLRDGTLPEFGPAAAAKMAVFAGADPEAAEAEAWRAPRDAFERFDVAHRYLFTGR